MSWRMVNADVFGLWHDCFGHLGAMVMNRIIENTKGHPFKEYKGFVLSKNYFYESCSQRKLITRPFIAYVDYESSSFLQRIKGDIYRPIQRAIGSFRYLMVLVNVSCIWFLDCLLSVCNVAFCMLTCTDYNALDTCFWI